MHKQEVTSQHRQCSYACVQLDCSADVHVARDKMVYANILKERVEFFDTHLPSQFAQ
jgi:hypothetical protein